MSFSFNEDQRAELIPLIDAALRKVKSEPASEGIFSDVYDRLLGMISYDGIFWSTGPAPKVDPNVWGWIYGAKRVNENSGGFAAFIRSYTELQHEVRYGSLVEPAEIQIVSNQVSENFFADINESLGKNHPSEWILPTIRRIGEHDAGAAASVVFEGDFTPWAGTLLFPYLNEPYFFESLLLTSEPVNRKSDQNHDPSSISKYEHGSYDLISAIMAGKLATLKNLGALLWEEISTGTPEIDSSHYRNISNEYIRKFYGLSAEDLRIYNPGGALVFEDVGAIFPDATYRVGSLLDDHGERRIILDGELKVLVNSGRGDDEVGVGFVPSGSAVVVDLIADGSIGTDSFSYGPEWNFALDLSLIMYTEGYYESYVKIKNSDEISGKNLDHRLYGFEEIDLSTLSDTFILPETLDESFNGLIINGGEHSKTNSLDRIIGDTIDLSSAGNGLRVSLQGTDDTVGKVSISDSSIDITGFENVIGSAYDDTITGGDGANIIVGSSGADTIDGGSGLDLLDFSQAEASFDEDGYAYGIDVSLSPKSGGGSDGDEYTNIEAVLGSSYGDWFTATEAGGMFAGGDGDDGFDIEQGALSGAAPTIVWGGLGEDYFYFSSTRQDPVGILVAEVDNLTQENFHRFDYQRLSGVDWSLVDVVILNPDADDALVANHGFLGTGRSTISATADYEQYGLTDIFGEVEVQTNVNSEISQKITGESAGGGIVEKYEVGFWPEPVYAAAYNVAYYTVHHFHSRRADVEADQERVATGTETYDGTTADATTTLYYESDPGPHNECPENYCGEPDTYAFDFYAWIAYTYYDGGRIKLADREVPGKYASQRNHSFLDRDELPIPEDVDDIGGWFLVGGEFNGLQLSADGTYTTSIPDAEGNFDAGRGSNTTTYSGSVGFGGPTTAYVGFMARSSILVLDGSPVDPNILEPGKSISQEGSDVLISSPEGDVLLRDVDLVEWRTASSQQRLGTDADEQIEASNTGERITSGAGDDTILALGGDDTISYVSGNDRIVGSKRNAGQDTLDLSQYSPEELGFRIDGSHVLIDTPEGTIQLDSQVRYGAGHHRTNIEILLLSDRQLDERAIRLRAVNDASSDADDLIVGTILDDTFLGSSGNDTVQAAGGNDIIFYSSGNDKIDGGDGGQDALDLTQYRSDQADFRAVGDDVFIDLPDGKIELDYQIRYEVSHSRSNIEQIVFSDIVLDELAIAKRSIDDQHSAHHDNVVGTRHADLIIGSTGDDTIDAWIGDDTIIYHSGNDLIIGGLGYDSLDLGRFALDELSFKANGYDIVIQTPESEVQLYRQIRYAAGNERTNIEELLLADAVLDDAGIRQKLLDDQRSSGDDFISGTAHSDLISGGLGNDTLLGGTGADIFLFRIDDGDNVILDFEDGVDQIRLSGLSNGFSDITIAETDGEAALYSDQGLDIVFSGLAPHLITQDDFHFV